MIQPTYSSPSKDSTNLEQSQQWFNQPRAVPAMIQPIQYESLTKSCGAGSLILFIPGNSLVD